MRAALCEEDVLRENWTKAKTKKLIELKEAGMSDDEM
jgi:hypothetical protein